MDNNFSYLASQRYIRTPWIFDVTDSEGSTGHSGWERFESILAEKSPLGKGKDGFPVLSQMSIVATTFLFLQLIKVNRPDLVLFVGEALVGNEAVDQLTKFNQALADHSSMENPRLIDGILLTKFDTIDDQVGHMSDDVTCANNGDQKEESLRNGTDCWKSSSTDMCTRKVLWSSRLLSCYASVKVQ